MDSAKPSRLYGGSAQGILQSDDAGDSWHPSGPGSATGQIDCLEIDPKSSSTIFACTRWMVASFDGGATWSERSNGLGDENSRVVAVTFDSQVEGRLYAGLHPGGVFRTDDTGLHWHSTGISDPYVLAIAAHPTVGGIVLAGTATSGVFRSTDGGDSWLPSSSGLPEGAQVTSLAIDPNSPSVAYAAVYREGVFKSIDGGISWTIASAGLTDQSTYYLTLDPDQPSHLFVSSGRIGVSRSVDSGAHWTESNRGLRGHSLRSLQVDPAHPGTLFAAMGSGVYKTEDLGTTWTYRDVGDRIVDRVRLHPAEPARLYATTAGAGIHRSTDGGETWESTNEGIAGLYATALALDPTSPSRLFAFTDGGVHVSTDGGDFWTLANSGLENESVQALVVDPANPGTVLAGSGPSNPSSVFRSVNSGGSWTQAIFDPTWSSVTDIEGTEDGSLFFASTRYDGVFRSTDSGATWAGELHNAPPYLNELAIDAGLPPTVYVGGSLAGVSRSRDSGESWQDATGNLPSSIVISLAVSRGEQPVLVASTGGAGLWILELPLFQDGFESGGLARWTEGSEPVR